VVEKALEAPFIIIPTSDLFHVKLGHPWLKSMKAIPSIFHECLKFPHKGRVHVIHHSGFKPLATRKNFNLD